MTDLSKQVQEIRDDNQWTLEVMTETTASNVGNVASRAIMAGIAGTGAKAKATTKANEMTDIQNGCVPGLIQKAFPANDTKRSYLPLDRFD